MANSAIFGRSENVALNSGTFKEFARIASADRMTIGGAVEKTAILLALVVASAATSWLLVVHNPVIWVWVTAAALTAFVVGLITCSNKQAAPVTAPVYAVLEGCVLGSTSAGVETMYPGVVLPAVVLTFAVLSGLLILYKVSGFRVTAKFWAGVGSATWALVVLYAVTLVLDLFGLPGTAFLVQGGLIGVGLSLVVVAIAALNLVLDFDLIESGARDGAPKYMEWYAAFGLMVTLIWLYWEVLKLLVQLAASSDDR